MSPRSGSPARPLGRALALVVAGLCLTALLPPGVVPVGSAAAAPTTIDDCTVISDPGEYVLAGSVTALSDELTNGACIYINASRVTLDGAGNRISVRTRATEASDQAAVGVAAASEEVGLFLNGVTVRNLTVNDGTGAVRFTGVSGGRIENVDAQFTERYGFRIVGGSAAVVDSSARVSGTFDGREAAVRFENARATVIGGTFQGNSRVEYGVRIDGGSDHEIRDVRVADLNANLGAGIDVGGDRSLVRNVTVERVHEGVVARGTLLRILDNRVERTTGDGVFVSGDAPRVRRNLVVLSNANGLFVGGIEAEVTANVVRDSARDGLGLSGGRTVARDNVITGSGGDGVFLFTDGITLENTTVADSRGGGIVSQGDGTVIRGAAVRNTGGTAVDYAGGNRGDNLLLADVLIDGAFAGVNVSRGTNVTLDGVRVNDTDEAGISLGVYSRNVGNVSGSLVRNVTVTNAGDDAIRLGTGRDVRLEDVTVAGGSGDGVAARSVADLSLIGVAVANVSGTGVRTDRTAGLVLEEVRATDNGGVGVSVGGQLGTDSTVRARGVRAERNGGAGVSLRVVTGGTLRDLALRNNGGTGLSAVFTSDVAVRNLSTTDNSGFGAALLSRNVTLSDTVATGNGDGPLSVPSGAPNAVENLTTERARLSATVTSVDVLPVTPPAAPAGRVLLAAVNVTGDGFGTPRANLSIAYAEPDDEDGVGLFRYDTGAWTPLSGATVDATADRVRANLTTGQFGTLGVLADESAPSAPDVTGDGRPATDPDGDGRYEDVNGDGDATPGDATVLFNAVFEGRAAVTDNVALFDFSGDGSLTPGDATVLFEEIF